MLTGVLFYVFYAGLLSGAALWALDRILRIGPGSDSQDHIFAAGACVLGVCLGTLVMMLSRAGTGFIVFPLLLALGFWAFYGWRKGRVEVWRKLELERLAADETASLRALERDPLNGAAWTRLAEIREARGDILQALAHMRKVCELEPTEQNRWKLKELEERLRSSPGTVNR